MDEDLLRTLGFSPRLLAKAIAALNKHVDFKQIPGYCLALCKPNQPAFTFEYGYRDIVNQQAFQADTIVRIASLSKPIFTLVVLMLVSQGKCQLNDAVSRYLPEVGAMQVLLAGTESNPKFEQVTETMTLHHLLSHQSGLGYDYNVPVKLRSVYEDSDLFDRHSNTSALGRRLCQLPLLFQPGRGFQYGLSTDLLGCVIEEIAQQPLDEVLSALVLKPLMMSDTGFYLTAEKQARAAELYKLGASKQLTIYSSSMHEKFNSHTDLFSAGGGLLSTLKDYIQFTQLLLSRGSSDGQEFIRPDLFASMVQNQMNMKYAPWGFGRHVQYDTQDYGFGYNVKVLIDSNQKDFSVTAGEYGWAGACNSYLWVNPAQEYAVVLFSHWVPFARLSIDPEIKRLIYQSHLN